MAAGTRVPLAEAQVLADELRTLLQPVCLQIEVAGSIRRQRPDVADIELLAIPLWQARFDLFGESNQPPISQLELLCQDLIDDGTFGIRHANGAKYKALRFKGIPVDLFTADPHNWGLLFAIRTGPALWSKRLVTEQRYGGWLPGHLQVKDGHLWRRDPDKTRDVGRDNMIPVPNEAALFKMLARPFQRPEERFDP